MSDDGQRRPKLRSPLFELTRARLLEFVREPEAVFWVFIFPALLAVVLGIAFRNKPADKPRVAVDAALVRESPRVARALLQATELEASRPDRATASRWLRRGRLDLVVLPGSSAGDGAASLTYRFDPSRPEGLLARAVVDDIVQRALGRRDAIVTQNQVATEPGGRYIDFLLPGLIGLNVMGGSMWGIGFALVLMRRRKFLRSLAVTPVLRSHLLLSFFLSRLGYLVLEVMALLLVGWLIFGVALRGSVGAILLVSILGGASFAGLSLLIAARTESIEAASGWMNAVQLPMWLLSGSFFSYERFPEVVHLLIRLLPLTALNDSLRDLMLDGGSALAQGPRLLVLVAWGGLAFVGALRLFRWQ